jgi:hypothetical protein
MPSNITEKNGFKILGYRKQGLQKLYIWRPCERLYCNRITLNPFV